MGWRDAPAHGQGSLDPKLAKPVNAGGEPHNHLRTERL